MKKSALDIEEIMVDEKTVEVPLDLLRVCFEIGIIAGWLTDNPVYRDALAQLKALIDESS